MILLPPTGTHIGQSRRSAPNPHISGLEAHTTQTNTVTGKDEALRILRMTQFKCSCKTRSLLILGIAEEKVSETKLSVCAEEMERAKEKDTKTQMTREEEKGRGQRKEIIIRNKINLTSCACFLAPKKTRSYQANSNHLLHCWLWIKMSHTPSH